MVPNIQEQTKSELPDMKELQALFEEEVQSNNITLADAELLHCVDLKM